MFEQLFTSLNHAVESTPAIALSASLVWGILSILLSPCHLASIPLVVGFVQGQGKLNPRRAFLLSSLFAMGILITIAAIGLSTAALGRMLGDVGMYGNYFIATIFFVVGLYLLDVIPLSWSGMGQQSTERRGAMAALVLGLLFGVAVGPCTFAYMAPMLGATFRLANTNLLYATALLLAYALGHCSVIVAAGTSSTFVKQVLNWNEQSRGAEVLKRVCGILVIAAGLYLLWKS